MPKVAINGLGRVGRQVFKKLYEDFKHIDIVAVNDLTDEKTLAHLLKYDSSYGIAPFEITPKDGEIVFDRRSVPVFKEKDPAKLPWKSLNVDIVVESTGIFTEAEKAKAHLNAGAKKVIISAPATGEDITVVLGVNEGMYDPLKHFIISNASCTTNSLAPVVKVLHDNLEILNGFMTTIHSYTMDQRLLDYPHKDLRRARSAAMNIIPTTTGASKAVALTIPSLKGKLDGIALRVPTPTVSLTVFDATVKKDITKENLNKLLKEASETYLKGILGYSEEPLVSMDYKGSTYSGIIDALSTKAVGNLVQVLSWYDNEWGYASRVADLVDYIAKKNGF